MSGYCSRHKEYDPNCALCRANGEPSVCSNGGLCAENSNVVEVTENFYLRATLACIATKKTDDAATLKAIANNALDAIGA